MSVTSGLPAGMLDWVAEVAGGPVVRAERHVARREAWVVDAERPDGSLLEGFLRLERDPKPGNMWSLEKETAIVTALGPTAVPVAMVHGWNADLTCALSNAWQAPVKSLPLRPAIAVPSWNSSSTPSPPCTVSISTSSRSPSCRACAGRPRPATPHSERSRRSCRPGLAFSRPTPIPSSPTGWTGYAGFAPEKVSRISLVQGDTGPGNFVFDGNELTAIVDFEWGHFGDPLEDLGNVCVREFWTPSGCLDGALLARYEKASGIPVDLATVRYYRVQQNVRGMIPIHAATRFAGARGAAGLVSRLPVHRRPGDLRRDRREHGDHPHRTGAARRR